MRCAKSSLVLLVVLSCQATLAQAPGGAGMPQMQLAPPNGQGGGQQSGRGGQSLGANPGLNANPANQANPVAGRPQPMPSPVVDFDLTNEVIDRVSPFSPAEVRRLRGELEERERAWYENLGKRPQPKAVVSEYRLDLSPGATPPVVRVTLGQGALVTFLSADAKPWPIKESDNFNSKGIRVTQLSAHVLSVSLLSPYATGSVGVILDGLASGVTFSVVPAQAETDHRAEMIVPRMLAVAEGGQVGESYVPMPGFNTAELSQYLLKIPPPTARELKIVGNIDVRAWQSSKDRMVVRTAMTVVSPAAFKRHSSADGTHVYEMPLSPVITVQGPRATYQTVVIEGIQVYGSAVASSGSEKGGTQK